MDKITFEKEILNQTQPNYVLGFLNQVAIDRTAIIRNVVAADKLAARIDFLYAYSFASLIRASASTKTIDEITLQAPQLVISACNWFDRAQNLVSQIQNLKTSAANTGILAGYLTHIARR